MTPWWQQPVETTSPVTQTQTVSDVPGTGTVTLTKGSTLVTGTATNFTTLASGDHFTADGKTHVVYSVTNVFELQLATPATASYEGAIQNGETVWHIKFSEPGPQNTLFTELETEIQNDNVDNWAKVPKLKADDFSKTEVRTKLLTQLAALDEVYAVILKGVSNSALEITYSNTQPPLPWQKLVVPGKQKTTLTAHTPKKANTLKANAFEVLPKPDHSKHKPYSQVPEVVISGSYYGAGAEAVAKLGLSDNSFQITSGTARYTTAPTVTISHSTVAPPGQQATAKAKLDSSGKVTGIEFENFSHRGWGYTTAPTINFSGGTRKDDGVGTPPDGQGNDKNFIVTKIVVTKGGVGYYSMPTVELVGPNNLSLLQRTGVGVTTLGGLRDSDFANAFKVKIKTNTSFAEDTATDLAVSETLTIEPGQPDNLFYVGLGAFTSMAIREIEGANAADQTYRLSTNIIYTSDNKATFKLSGKFIDRATSPSSYEFTTKTLPVNTSAYQLQKAIQIAIYQKVLDTTGGLKSSVKLDAKPQVLVTGAGTVDRPWKIKFSNMGVVTNFKHKSLTPSQQEKTLKNGFATGIKIAAADRTDSVIGITKVVGSGKYDLIFGPQKAATRIEASFNFAATGATISSNKLTLPAKIPVNGRPGCVVQVD